MDVETLFNMVKTAARDAGRACEQGVAKPNVYGYAGYTEYVERYNGLLSFVWEQFGDEACRLFRPIPPEATQGHSKPTLAWVTYSHMAANRLNVLAAFLQNKVPGSDRELQGVIDLVEAHLRPSVTTEPTKEADVQDVLETIFRVRELQFQRERVTIPYSSKVFRPDFTFDSMDLAVEVKLCNSAQKEKALVDEINADIPAYRTKYRKLLFVVYDLGIIRDVELFKSGIEGNSDVFVVLVKK